MGNTGGGEDDTARVARLVGDLLIGLGEKVRAAGPEGVRILTDEELQRDQLNWFRAGWNEHAIASAEGTGQERAGGNDGERFAPAPEAHRPHPDNDDFLLPAARLLRFPESGRAGAAGDGSYPLPIVGAGEARVRDLMPHRRRHKGGGAKDTDHGPGGPGAPSD
ncbi:hypothetical protein HW130_11765 [Streptomyces sp. PKU-EA00015]|uniref:hypothetical protein n=1 Tax=Streptomyces sp. PKU-EA00015 TaxID=2748326 RepID=UPI0015A1CB0E|nr:hypothetical protein [Streptomyces sp. PKU-EA00015]NWF26938.1 hypothetical protein [Streptomyces sp. PKU-EA00015]